VISALLGRSKSELEEWAVTQGQPAFRGRQLHDWLYSKGARDLQGITVLPKAWRASLQDEGVSVGRLHEQERRVGS
jgi:23S rRNA (adenine2503-C2)-methyltransferase